MLHNSIINSIHHNKQDDYQRWEVLSGAHPGEAAPQGNVWSWKQAGIETVVTSTKLVEYDTDVIWSYFIKDFPYMDNDVALTPSLEWHEAKFFEPISAA